MKTIFSEYLKRGWKIILKFKLYSTSKMINDFFKEDRSLLLCDCPFTWDRVFLPMILAQKKKLSPVRKVILVFIKISLAKYVNFLMYLRKIFVKSTFVYN